MSGSRFRSCRPCRPHEPRVARQRARTSAGCRLDKRAPFGRRPACRRAPSAAHAAEPGCPNDAATMQGARPPTPLSQCRLMARACAMTLARSTGQTSVSLSTLGDRAGGVRGLTARLRWSQQDLCRRRAGLLAARMAGSPDPSNRPTQSSCARQRWLTLPRGPSGIDIARAQFSNLTRRNCTI